ncbi:hypothetical protein MMC18_001090 [Xylographa bjoerkii]|nr:hypothetical protein [Xylographa bjoerkii]
MLNSSTGNVAATQIPKPTNQQLNRACESCRLLKVRCLSDDATSSQQCQRCSKAGRQCIFVAPQRKRPRKRTDARVAELEREVRAMRALLKNAGSLHISDGIETEGKGKADKDDSDLSMDEEYALVRHGENTLNVYEPPAPTGKTSATRHISTILNRDELSDLTPADDVVGRGVISMDAAAALVALYVTELVQHFPVVILPEDCTAFELRVTKPVLFLAVIAAASLGGDSELSHTLYKEVIRVYADRIIITGEKSLELVQSLLLTVAYCYPPDSSAHLQFYQYSHMAATMALDIGLGSKPRALEHPALPTQQKDQGSLYDGDTVNDISLLEKCRTMLICYAVTAGLGVTLRRPSMLVFNNWMGECLRFLEESPAILNRRLAALVTLQRIADEASASFGFDDPSTTIGLSESHTQVIVKSFESRMEEWKRLHSPHIMDVSLTIAYYQNHITIYEFAMDDGHRDVESSKGKYFSSPTPDDDKSAPPVPLSATQLNATMKCMSSAQALLNTFLETAADTMRTLPNYFYVRTIYSIVVLLKLFVAISATGFGQLIDSRSLKIDHYIDQVTQRLTEAAGPTKSCRVPNKWLPVIHRLKNSHEQHKAKDIPAGSAQPFMSITNSFLGECNFGLIANEAHSLATPESKAGPARRKSDSTAAGTNAAWGSPQDALFNRIKPESIRPVLPNSVFATMPDYSTGYGQNDQFHACDLDEDFTGWVPDASMFNDVDFGSMFQELERNLGNGADRSPTAITGAAVLRIIIRARNGENEYALPLVACRLHCRPQETGTAEQVQHDKYMRHNTYN